MPRLVTILLGAIILIVAVVGLRSLMSGGETVARVQASTIPTLDKALPGTAPPTSRTSATPSTASNRAPR